MRNHGTDCAPDGSRSLPPLQPRRPRLRRHQRTGAPAPRPGPGAGPGGYRPGHQLAPPRLQPLSHGLRRPRQACPDRRRADPAPPRVAGPGRLVLRRRLQQPPAPQRPAPAAGTRASPPRRPAPTGGGPAQCRPRRLPGRGLPGHRAEEIQKEFKGREEEAASAIGARPRNAASPSSTPPAATPWRRARVTSASGRLQRPTRGGARADRRGHRGTARGLAADPEPGPLVAEGDARAPRSSTRRPWSGR